MSSRPALLAVAGGSWMVLGSAEQLQISAYGVGLCLVAGLSYAAYTLISKRMVSVTPAPIVTLCIFSCAAAMAASSLVFTRSVWTVCPMISLQLNSLLPFF